MEVVEAGVGVVVVAAVADGVDGGHGAGGGEGGAPGVVGVFGYAGTGSGDQALHVALLVCQIVVGDRVCAGGGVDAGVGDVIIIIDNIQGSACPGLAHHLAVLGDVVIGRGTDGLGGTDAGLVIAIRRGRTILGGTGKAAALDPCHGVPAAVKVAGGVTDGVIGNGAGQAANLKVGEQVLPVGIAILLPPFYPILRKKAIFFQGNCMR